MDDITPIRKPEIVGEAGGLVDESRLTLGIHGEDLDPDEISRLLGCAPTSCHRRGDARRSGPPWARGGWLLSVEAKSPAGPEELVQLLLTRFPTEQAVWADLRRRFTSSCRSVSSPSAGTVDSISPGTRFGASTSLELAWASTSMRTSQTEVTANPRPEADRK